MRADGLGKLYVTAIIFFIAWTRFDVNPSVYLQYNERRKEDEKSLYKEEMSCIDSQRNYLRA